MQQNKIPLLQNHKKNITINNSKTQGKKEKKKSLTWLIQFHMYKTIKIKIQIVIIQHKKKNKKKRLLFSYLIYSSS